MDFCLVCSFRSAEVWHDKQRCEGFAGNSEIQHDFGCCRCSSESARWYVGAASCMNIIIIHAGVASDVSRAFSCVCLFVHALKGKRLELSTPNLVHMNYSCRSACIDQRSKGHTVTKTSRYTVASDCSWRHVTLFCATFSASEVTTIWRYTNVYISIIIIITCGRCRRGSACRYVCLFFLVMIIIYL